MSTTLKTWLGVLGALVVALFVVLVWALLLRGPGGVRHDAASAATPSSSPSTEATPSASPSAEGSPSSSEMPQSPSPSPTQLAPIPDGAIEAPTFALPSRNIACVLDEEGARCQIGDSTFTGPGVPTCEAAGKVVALTSDGVAVTCLDGAPLTDPAAAPVLEYGQTSAVGPWLCTSSDRGIECTSRADGTGFALARASLTSYGPGRLM